MKKLSVLCFALLSMLPLVSAICILPQEGMNIQEDTVFCSGFYYIEKGLNIATNSIIVDCNSSVFVGDGIGYGFLLKDVKNVVLQNCNISNLEIGIYLENANNSMIRNNYLVRNKFGIASFNSFNNNVNDNLFSNNINSNQVFYLSTPILQQEPLEHQEKESNTTPQQVIEEVIRIKKPFLEQQKILDEVNLILGKYFDATRENLEISRSIIYNESDKSTRVVILLKPKKVLLNLSIYEKIPKCVSTYIGQILFEAGGYEVINEEPLILWYFPRLDKEEKISYKVFKRIDDECQKLLLAFGIATGFEKFKSKKYFEREKGINVNYLLILAIVIVIVVILYLICRKYTISL